MALNQAEALRILRAEAEEVTEKQLAESKKIIDWANQPITKQILKELEEKEKKFRDKILKGGCKDYAEYLGCVFAISKKVKGLDEIIQKHKNLYNRIVLAKQKQQRGK